MKTLIVILTLVSLTAFGQADQTLIIVNTRDNAKLQFNGNPVKTKAIVYSFKPVSNSTKDFEIVLVIQMYSSVSGSYGSLITSLISADGTLSQEEKDDLLIRYQDKVITYSTANRFTDVSGNIVLSTTPGAIPEIQYWQTFKLNQIAGMGSASTQGALDAEYLTIKAIVNKMDSRKNF